MKKSRSIHKYFLLFIIIMIVPLFGGFLPKWNMPNIILITLDTTRSDHLGLYGYQKNTTPNIDRLGKECAVFEQAITPVPLTLPAHVSILTGTYPAYHNVRDNSIYQLSSDAITLAEVLKKNGYQTAGFVAAYVLHRKFGLNQGFDIYNDDFSAGRRSSLVYAEKDAKAVTDAVINWLSAGFKQPLFLWVHYYDPHDPYTPPPEYSKRTGSAYDGEIAYMDEQFGRLMSNLKGRKLLDNSLVIIVGDHGEGLKQHQEEYHGIFLYDTTLKVPLILCNASPDFVSKKITSQVSLLDLFPTIVNFLEIEGYKSNQGTNLLPLIKGIASPEVPIYLETMLPFFTYGLSPMEGVRTSSHKFVKAPKSELFDLTKDKGENTNLFKMDTERAKKMLNKMNKIKSEILPPLKPTMMAVDKESMEMLASLGYLSLPTQNVPKTNLLDPKDHIGIFEKFTDAQDAMGAGKYPEALEVLKRIKKKIPDSHLVNFMMGQCNAELEKYQEALKLFEAEKSYYREIAFMSTGNVYFKMRDFEKAIAAYQEALKINPDMFEAYVASGEIYVLQGKINEAEPLLAKADQKKINDAKLRFLQGLVMAIKQNYNAAESYFKEAIKLSPNYGMAYASLGKVSMEKGDNRSALMYYQRAMSLVPNNKDIILTLASLYLKPGSVNVPEAYNLYKKAYEMEPNAPDSESIRAVMKDLEETMKIK